MFSGLPNCLQSLSGCFKAPPFPNFVPECIALHSVPCHNASWGDIGGKKAPQSNAPTSACCLCPLMLSILPPPTLSSQYLLVWALACHPWHTSQETLESSQVMALGMLAKGALLGFVFKSSLGGCRHET